ncbi:ABC transporter ATP-binding protein [Streptomyces europaeiscabiei]|uniref:ABC transporter ATP-binding protein n=1 Tax=Streptomyces TaxID=1883 RepID=UPI000A3B3836|nr:MULTISPECIES: ABC transporter ATP-binding protein [Streptomyces]MDX3587662.1 ABC transporter ATP-binding protein [Streptomyces europaeiscabiei]MDX3616693.1 ABC transporter ATP-binding protein [Streptomyces europaeiscabiei]MDX3631865.1 ABC transporter ATP-binding protein [Streptomyces europaeiscabiei]MDX3649646.1 ABC transporter ATP-binding protein [Streptomyces europaeiscabiei]WUD34305.1 ABC transporter ATP-binding protein [Streptomyces europaeiscabiei]
MTTLLELRGLTRSYGSLTAVDQVDLTITRGERHALIGPNGAGKSTLFATMAGTLRASAGRIMLAGQDVTALPEAERARRGMVRTFQHSSLFLDCSVLDNVALAVQRVHGVAHRFDRAARRFRRTEAEARRHLDSVGLAGRAQDKVAALSHGERRQLEVAMVLATEPALVMFDEPTAGMSAAETERFVALMERLPEHLTVLVVEHDLDVVFRLADRVTVLHLGKVLASGRPEEIRADEAVRRAYLGSARSEDLFAETGGA